ncbi:MAG: hypothetical protein BRC30_02780 [Nanohaloarchaea archaeon SW_7_46_7]|nr:MAG: hypothetical protein BRC30_02780 [Nanohaloarchaea archaeon SW_7_46_7]
MKHLVIGKGFIGSAIGQSLEGEVKYLDRSTGDYQQDVTKSFKIEEEFDVVYHTVGLAPGFASKKQYEQVQVKGTENIVKAVNADKIVYISALNPEIDHPFFQTKKEAEKIIRESDMKHTILRPSTVIGTGNKLLDMIRKTSFTQVFPQVTTRMQPIRLEDLVDIAEKVKDRRDGETLNTAGPEKMTVSEMAEKLYRQEGKNCYIIPLPEGFLETFLSTFGYVNIPPLTRENAKLMGADNKTDENHAPQLTQLEKAF